MNATSIFVGIMLILLIFNWVYYSAHPTQTWNLMLGGIIGFVATICATGVISGINVFGSGLTGQSVKIIFGISSLINILFQINIAGFPVGMGLANNIFAVFAQGDLWGIGFFLAIGMSVMAIACGLIIIIGGQAD